MVRRRTTALSIGLRDSQVLYTSICLSSKTVICNRLHLSQEVALFDLGPTLLPQRFPHLLSCHRRLDNSDLSISFTANRDSRRHNLEFRLTQPQFRGDTSDSRNSPRDRCRSRRATIHRVHDGGEGKINSLLVDWNLLFWVQSFESCHSGGALFGELTGFLRLGCGLAVSWLAVCDAYMGREEMKHENEQ